VARSGPGSGAPPPHRPAALRTALPVDRWKVPARRCARMGGSRRLAVVCAAALFAVLGVGAMALFTVVDYHRLQELATPHTQVRFVAHLRLAPQQRQPRSVHKLGD